MAKKILIVDDSRTIIKLNTHIINKLLPDGEIIAYNTPLEAVEALKNNNMKFDFAFLDYNMDGMNGVELAQALVELPSSPITYGSIAVVSANVQDAVTGKARALGMEFIPKPFDEQKLKNFLKLRGMTFGQ